MRVQKFKSSKVQVFCRRNAHCLRKKYNSGNLLLEIISSGKISSGRFLFEEISKRKGRFPKTPFFEHYALNTSQISRFLRTIEASRHPPNKQRESSRRPLFEVNVNASSQVHKFTSSHFGDAKPTTKRQKSAWSANRPLSLPFQAQ